MKFCIEEDEWYPVLSLVKPEDAYYGEFSYEMEDGTCCWIWFRLST